MIFKGKGINLQALVESGCYLIFSLLIYRLTASGRYLNYVTPRMKPFLYGLSLLMLIWAVVEGRHIFTPRYKARLSRTFVLIFPILLLLSPPPPPDGSSMIRSFDDTGFTVAAGAGRSAPGGNQGGDGYVQGGNGYGQGGGGQNGGGQNGGGQNGYGQNGGSQNANGQDGDDQNAKNDDGYWEEDGSQDDDGSQDNGESQEDGEPQDNGELEEDGQLQEGGQPQDNGEASNKSSEIKKIGLKGLNESTKTITIADEDYYAWMVELGTNPAQYKGYTVVVKGFIYRDSEVVKKCDFALVRLSMWCCAADLFPVGFLIDYDEKMKFGKDEWVVVTGTFGVNGDGSLHLNAKSIVAGKKPQEEYIYPF